MDEPRTMRLLQAAHTLAESGRLLLYHELGPRPLGQENGVINTVLPESATDYLHSVALRNAN